jgi:hypothetical protein
MMCRSEAGTVKSADSEPGHHSDCGLAFQSSRQKDRYTIEVRLHACKTYAYLLLHFRTSIQVMKVHGYIVFNGVPDPRSCAFFTSGSRIWIRGGGDPGWKKNLDPGSRMNILALIFENLVAVFWVNNTYIL